MSVKVDWDIKEIVEFNNLPKELTLEEIGWHIVSKDYKRLMYNDGYLIGFEMGTRIVDVCDDGVKVEEGVHGVTIVLLWFSNVVYLKIDKSKIKKWLAYDTHTNNVSLVDNPEDNIMERGRIFYCPIARDPSYASDLVRKEIVRMEK